MSTKPSHNNKIHPPIFIINLEQDIKKKQLLIKLCDTYNLSPEFIKAVDGRLLNHKEIEAVYSKNEAINKIGRELSKGEIGCALSHKKIYQKMINENISEAIILEDDIEFNIEFIDFTNHINFLPRNSELILLGYWYKGVNNVKKTISYGNKINISSKLNLVRFIKSMHGTYGYYINIMGAKKMLHNLNDILTMPLDCYTNDEKKINVYGIYPPTININYYFDINTELEKERENERAKYIPTNIIINYIKIFLKRTGTFKIIKRIILFLMAFLENVTNFYKRLIKRKAYK